MLGLIVATCVVTLIPGPSMLLIMLNAVERGLAQGIYTALGAVVADAILLVLIMAGLGALLETSPTLYLALKWGGAAWLVYLGGAQLLSSPRENAPAQGQSKTGSFTQGLATTLLNPKIVGFLVAFFPQFVDDSGPPLARQLATLGPVFLATVLVLFITFALFAAALTRAVAADKIGAAVKFSSGLGLVGCGIYGFFS